MRHRDMLHISKLAEFRAFCELQGWISVPPSPPWEVLRMRRAGFAHPLIVHTKAGAKEHYTTWGNSAKMLQRFLAAKRKG